MKAKRTYLLNGGLLLILIILTGWLSWTVYRVRQKMYEPTVETASVDQYLQDPAHIDSFPDLSEHVLFHAQFSADSFSSPPQRFRPSTKWWWPGDYVQSNRIRDQLVSMHNMGFGGVEIHSLNAGLDPDLSQNESKLVKGFGSNSHDQHITFAMQTADSLGMLVALPTGSGWPAGGPHINLKDNLRSLSFGEAHILGGKTVEIKLPAPNPPAAHYYTAFYEHFKPHDGLLDFFPEQAELICLLAGKARSGRRNRNPLVLNDQVSLDPDSLFVIDQFLGEDQMIRWEAPPGYWEIIAIYQMPSGSRPIFPAYEQAGLVLDHFDSLHIISHHNHLLGTKRGYASHYGKAFQSISQSAFRFMTERHFSKDFLIRFKAARGYDLLPFLPAVLRPAEDNFYLRNHFPQRLSAFRISQLDPRVRHDFDLTVSDLFIDHMLRTSRIWAEDHGLLYRAQVYGLSLDIMRAAGQVHIPEISQEDADQHPLFLSLLASGAQLYGRQIVSAVALAHQEADQAGHPQSWKRDADQLFVNGFNHLVYHGIPYQLESRAYGETNWAPFSSAYQSESSLSENLGPGNAFHAELSEFNAYVSRCQYLLQQGDFEADVLILYPFLGFPFQLRQSNVSSREEQKEGIPAQWLEKVQQMVQGLDARGISWRWVNPHALQKAEVVDGNILINGQSFQSLILPNVPAISRELSQKVSDLAKKSRVLIYGDSPDHQAGYLGARENDLYVQMTMDSLASRYQFTQLKDLMDQFTGFPLRKPFIFQQSMPFLRQHQRKTEAGDRILFLSNQSEAQHFFTLIPEESDQYFYWMNPQNGHISPALPKEGGQLIGHLPSHGSIFLFASEQALTLPDSLQESFPSLAWKMAFSKQKETLPLNNWTFMVNGADVKGDKYQEDSCRFTDWRNIPAIKYSSSEGLYSTQFEMRDTIREALYLLDLGKVHQQAEIRLNTYQLGTISHEPYLMDISPYLNPGLNQLEVWVRSGKRNRLVGKAKRGEEIYQQFADLP
ncbi:MAG: glycosyl hydrolase, partial [Bacteroidota bacterium]